jgi:hypothetical protein
MYYETEHVQKGKWNKATEKKIKKSDAKELRWACLSVVWVRSLLF